MFTTTIHSNGSKWGGQEPDSIEKLIEVLGSYPLEDRFFGKYINGPRKKYTPFVLCPISKKDGIYWFFGNFEIVSHVFRIETNCPETISKLKAAIINNSGWAKNIGRCKNIIAN